VGNKQTQISHSFLACYKILVYSGFFGCFGESLRSLASRIMTKDKASLKPDIFSDLVTIKENAALLRKHHHVITKGKEYFVLPCTYDDHEPVSTTVWIQMFLDGLGVSS
jgi:hypothetical protein